MLAKKNLEYTAASTFSQGEKKEDGLSPLPEEERLSKGRALANNWDHRKRLEMRSLDRTARERSKIKGKGGEKEGKRRDIMRRCLSDGSGRGNTRRLGSLSSEQKKRHGPALLSRGKRRKEPLSRGRKGEGREDQASLRRRSDASHR